VKEVMSTAACSRSSGVVRGLRSWDCRFGFSGGSTGSQIWIDLR